MSVKSDNMCAIAMQFVEAVYGQSGVTLMICGGFARDRYFGLEPRDVDLIVLDNHLLTVRDINNFDEKMRKAARMLSTTCTVRDITVESDEGGDEYGDCDERIERVWHVCLDGVEIDIILNTENHKIKTQEDAVAIFDANISQYGLDEYGQAFFMGELDPEIYGLMLFKDVPDSRHERLNAKWAEIKAKLNK